METNRQKAFLLILVIFLAISATPYLSYNVPNIAMGAIYVLLIATFAFCYRSRYIENIHFFFVAYCLIMICYRFLNISTCSWNLAISRIIQMLIPVIALDFVPDSIEKERKILVVIFSLLFAFNLFDNIRLLNIYPTASEDLNFYWGEIYYSMNVGGSTFAFYVTLMALLFTLVFLYWNKCRPILLLLIIGSWVYVIISGRAISLISLVIGTVCLLIVRFMKNMDTRQQTGLCVVVISLVLISFFFLPKMLSGIAGMMGSERLSERFNELSLLLAGANSTESVSSGSTRIELYLLSLQTWTSGIRNFLFGIGEHPLVIDDLIKIGIGGHSFFFDFAAKFGLIGIVVLVPIVKGGYSRVYNMITDKALRRAANVIFAIFILNSFINNNFTVESAAVAYIVTPLVCILITGDVQKEIEGEDRYGFNGQ